MSGPTSVTIMRDGSGEVRCSSCFFETIAIDHEASKMKITGLVRRTGSCSTCNKKAEWWGMPEAKSGLNKAPKRPSRSRHSGRKNPGSK
jgi:hypothetical protein